MSDVASYAEMEALLAQMPLPETIVTTIEAGVMAIWAIRRALPAAPAPEPWRMSPVFGIPIVVNRDLSPWSWRALNGAGEVLHEGEVGQPVSMLYAEGDTSWLAQSR